MLTKVLPKSEISTRENLNWLFILRNLMLTGEALLITILIYVLDVKLPQELLWLALLSIGAVNLYTWMRLKTDTPGTESEIFSQLCIEVFAIASLLYMTGGASNPITWVFLLPLIITAIILPQAYAWYMVLLTITMYTLLIGYNIPLPSIEPHEMMVDEVLTPSMLKNMQHIHQISDQNFLNVHIFGMWFGFVFSAGLVAYFVVELAKTVREREWRLAEARENALRNERVVALGVLAASAAHDMGTPLGTMAIVTNELLDDFPEQGYQGLHERLSILQQQITRCKNALSLMAISSGEMRAESGNVIPVANYLDSLLTQWRAQNPTTTLNLNILHPSDHSCAKIIAEQSLTHAIINILNNAAEATLSEKGIDFKASWDTAILDINIRDYGSGLPKELIKVIGKQPVKSKKKQGLGVGIF